MPITAADLDNLLSLNMPTDDSGTSGGGIDVDGLASDLPLASANALEVVSSNAGDTSQQITVTGRDAAGSIISDTKTLNGTTVVSLTGTFERVLRVVLDSDCAGTVTLRIDSGGATVVAIPAGQRSAHRMFYDSASEASQVIRYEKMFWKNSHGTLTLTSATVEITADPTSNYRIGLAASKDDSGSVANRKSAPGGVSFSDSGAIAVPTGELDAGEAIGVWVEQTLAADEAATKSTFTTQLAGTTT